MDKSEYIRLRNQARDADLLQYLRTNGYQLEKSARNEYCFANNHSLKISNNLWNDFNAPDMGGNTLDFLIKYEGKEFNEAVKILTGRDIKAYNPYDHDTQPYEKYKRDTPEKPKELLLPAKSNTYNRVFAYLNKTRKIDSVIISELMKQKKIYESDRQNCVFVGTDDAGVIKFATERGTFSDVQYRKDCSGSDKSFSFYMEGKNERVYVLESPIEAMSHATLFKTDKKDFKQEYRLSLSGICIKGLESGTTPIALDGFLGRKPNIKDIILCLNNDEAGRDATNIISQIYSEKGYNVKVEFPRLKDFNEDLIALTNCMNKGMII